MATPTAPSSSSLIGDRWISIKTTIQSPLLFTVISESNHPQSASSSIGTTPTSAVIVCVVSTTPGRTASLSLRDPHPQMTGYGCLEAEKIAAGGSAMLLARACARCSHDAFLISIKHLCRVLSMLLADCCSIVDGQWEHTLPWPQPRRITCKRVIHVTKCYVNNPVVIPFV